MFENTLRLKNKLEQSRQQRASSSQFEWTDGQRSASVVKMAAQEAVGPGPYIVSGQEAASVVPVVAQEVVGESYELLKSKKFSQG